MKTHLLAVCIVRGVLAFDIRATGASEDALYLAGDSFHVF